MVSKLWWRFLLCTVSHAAYVRSLQPRPPPVPCEVEDQHPARARGGEADEDVGEGWHAQQPVVPRAAEIPVAAHPAFAHGDGGLLVVPGPPSGGPQAGPAWKEDVGVHGSNHLTSFRCFVMPSPSIHAR